MIKKRIIEWLLQHGPMSRVLAILLFLRKRSYLSERGWFKSVRRAMPVDGNDRPIPWYTYPAIEFLEPRIDRNMEIFEYGSGNSTIWWASRVASVISCEHDREWYEAMKTKLPGNVSYSHHELGSGYPEAILPYQNEFDIIVIDGRERVQCAKNCLNALTDSGVIVWDNSDRDHYQEGFDFLRENGFRRLDFSGPGPIVFVGSCTSIFYKATNGIGI